MGSGPFFTMELFQGRPITSLAGRSRRGHARPVLQVTHALDYIHHMASCTATSSRRTSWSGRRPVAMGLPGFEAKLMDFGLAKYYGVKTSLSAEAGFVGTVAYCAPGADQHTTSSTTAPTSTAWGWSAMNCSAADTRFPEARLAGMRPLIGPT